MHAAQRPLVDHNAADCSSNPPDQDHSDEQVAFVDKLELDLIIVAHTLRSPRDPSAALRVMLPSVALACIAPRQHCGYLHTCVPLAQIV